MVFLWFSYGKSAVPYGMSQAVEALAMMTLQQWGADASGLHLHVHLGEVLGFPRQYGMVNGHSIGIWCPSS